MKKHKESNLQIRCVKHFRYEYPEFARLLYHPHNEGNAFNRLQQSIANKEGVVKGVADLILQVPSYFSTDGEADDVKPVIRHSLAIELKDGRKGRQSPEQITWQRLFEAAGGIYLVVRNYDDFVFAVDKWMLYVPLEIKQAVYETYTQIQAEDDRQAIALLKKITHGE